eukprot:Clim_evm19s139 gene=Clim_evmTU19s139
MGANSCLKGSLSRTTSEEIRRSTRSVCVRNVPVTEGVADADYERKGRVARLNPVELRRAQLQIKKVQDELGVPLECRPRFSMSMLKEEEFRRMCSSPRRESRASLSIRSEDSYGSDISDMSE